MKLREYLEDWLEGNVRGNVRTNTYSAYRGYVQNHISGAVGDKELGALKPEDIQRLVGVLHSEKGLSAKTVRAVVSMLSGCLRCAVLNERIVKNPCASLIKVVT